MEGQGRYGWSFPITRLTFQVRKAMGGVGCVACGIIVSAPVPVPFLLTLNDLELEFGTWIWDWTWSWQFLFTNYNNEGRKSLNVGDLSCCHRNQTKWTKTKWIWHMKMYRIHIYMLNILCIFSFKYLGRYRCQICLHHQTLIAIYLGHAGPVQRQISKQKIVFSHLTSQTRSILLYLPNRPN